MNETQVFAELEAREAVRAEVRFSGGNDEGGADSIYLYDARDEIVGDLEESWASGDTDDGRLADALVAPVYARFGSFAGEFEVYGTVVWDVASREVKMSGEQATMQEF